LQDPPVDGEAVAPLHLIGEQQGEEGGIVELLGAGKREALRQRRSEGAELEALEQPEQISIDGQGCTSVGVVDDA